MADRTALKLRKGRRRTASAENGSTVGRAPLRQAHERRVRVSDFKIQEQIEVGEVWRAPGERGAVGSALGR